MDNQEAIEILKTERNHMIPTLLPGRIEAMDMAISALQAQDLQLTCNQLATDAISRQAAIDEWKNDFKGYVNALNIPRDDYNGIMEYIDELPSAQPERTDCEYCHEDIDGYVKPIEKNCHAFIRFGMNGWELNLRAKGWHGEVKIKYCPICGRRLEL